MDGFDTPSHLFNNAAKLGHAIQCAFLCLGQTIRDLKSGFRALSNEPALFVPWSVNKTGRFRSLYALCSFAGHGEERHELK